MKWLRTIVVFDKGAIATTSDWAAIHSSYVRSITGIDFPAGSGTLTLQEKSRRSDGQWNRNGVGYLRNRFLQHLTAVEGWLPEEFVGLDPSAIQPTLSLYPSAQQYREAITSEFGGFDFVTTGTQGIKVAIEWETGNISSSHRSMNKLAIALANGAINAGVLIVPSRALYEHLTDRVGNIGELSGYLSMWESLKFGVSRGLMAISVVEHDALSSDQSHAYLPRGNDGRAKEGRERSTSRRLK